MLHGVPGEVGERNMMFCEITLLTQQRHMRFQISALTKPILVLHLLFAWKAPLLLVANMPDCFAQLTYRHI